MVNLAVLFTQAKIKNNIIYSDWLVITVLWNVANADQGV